MAEIENGYYYIKDGVVLKEDGYTNFSDKVGKVVGFEYEQEVRTKAIEEFAEKCNQKITEFILEHKEQLTFVSGVSVAWNIIDEIAESMKGEKK